MHTDAMVMALSAHTTSRLVDKEQWDRDRPRLVMVMARSHSTWWSRECGVRNVGGKGGRSLLGGAQAAQLPP